jgi:ribosomal subunit interface protein
MQINISGKHMELGDSFQQHVENRLHEGISKYLDRINQVEVVATKQGAFVRVDIHANTGTSSHLTINAHAQAAEAYGAFDSAAEKIEKQLRRYKRRITNHHRSRQDADRIGRAIQAKAYVISPESEAEEELPEELVPVVIAERQMDIEMLTVSEAVMKMDLASLPALMFYNSAHGRVNLVYRREDGNIGWIDPDEAQSKAA